MARAALDAHGHRRRSRAMRIDFNRINAAALSSLPSLLARWLPDDKPPGREYMAKNPRRADRHLGSFRVNLVTGKWADFAIGAKGGDVISLASSGADSLQHWLPSEGASFSMRGATPAPMPSAWHGTTSPRFGIASTARRFRPIAAPGVASRSQAATCCCCRMGARPCRSRVWLHHRLWPAVESGGGQGARCGSDSDTAV